jgi:protein-tyrosine phosphatase
MVDIHLHILPGLDDGPKDLETSVAMARMAADDGITHMVATPHANNRYPFDPVEIADRLSALREAVAGEGIALTLGSGCDFHMSYENIDDAHRHPEKYSINGKGYLLVELPDFSLPRQLDEAFYELRVAGLTPILTHPERNAALQKDSTRMEEWLRQGMLVQVTTSSVLGQMGPAPERMAHRLLANRWVHFLATDAHNLNTRPPRMRAACEFVARKYDPAYADRICVENPLAVFEGRPLPEQDEPLKLFDDNDLASAPWWKRLFRR